MIAMLSGLNFGTYFLSWCIAMCPDSEYLKQSTEYTSIWLLEENGFVTRHSTLATAFVGCEFWLEFKKTNTFRVDLAPSYGWDKKKANLNTSMSLVTMALYNFSLGGDNTDVFIFFFTNSMSSKRTLIHSNRQSPNSWNKLLKTIETMNSHMYSLTERSGNRIHPHLQTSSCINLHFTNQVQYAISICKSLQEFARVCVRTGCLTVLKVVNPARKCDASAMSRKKSQ
jgi:hypothetical protein